MSRLSPGSFLSKNESPVKPPRKRGEPPSKSTALLALTTVIIAVAFLILSTIGQSRASINETGKSMTASNKVESHASEGETARNLIIDTDMGLDDARAIFALIASRADEIKCFVTVEGSASLGKACDNLVGLLESMDIDDVPIYRGFRGINSAPPWRAISNTMANTPFPPPHEIEVGQKTLDNLVKVISKSGPDVTYVALGPLTNLARLEEHRPGILHSTGCIMLPGKVKIKGKSIYLKSWNLDADEKAAETVFKSARELLIVDVSCADKLAAAELLGKLSSSSPAAGWIKKNLKSLENMKKHIFIYDELLIPAVLDKGGLKLSGKKYSLDNKKNGSYILKEDSKGNITIAQLKSCKRAVAQLKEYWEKPVPKHDHSAELSIPARKLIKAFHGHLGPYVVLGFRASRIALSTLGHSGHFGISAEVFSTLKPPRSCFIDGVQLGSGCTLGKRNIEVHSTETPPHVTFSTFGGDTLSVFLKNSVPSLIDSLIQIGGVEYAGGRVLQMGADSLFNVKKGGLK